MHETSVVVIGASSGGLRALRHIVAGLPGDFPAPVCLVMHMPSEHESRLTHVIGRWTPLSVDFARDGERIQPGHMYVAPPDRHMLISDGALAIRYGARENHSRPAIDVLFRSAAHAHRDRTIGVVLSGSLDDGTAGLRSIKRHGGIAIVQDPADAMFPSMPLSAAEHVDVDYCAPAGGIAAILKDIVDGPKAPLRGGNGVSAGDGLPPRSPSEFSCPDCGGVLNELWQEAEYEHFMCRTGHAYSPSSLAYGQSRLVEESLWTALRAIEESISLARRMLERTSSTAASSRYERRLEKLEQSRTVVRSLLEQAAPIDS